MCVHIEMDRTNTLFNSNLRIKKPNIISVADVRKRWRRIGYRTINEPVEEENHFLFYVFKNVIEKYTPLLYAWWVLRMYSFIFFVTRDNHISFAIYVRIQNNGCRSLLTFAYYNNDESQVPKNNLWGRCIFDCWNILCSKAITFAIKLQKWWLINN